jgi:ABC-type branched-subunit amino acid transport system ATPase component
MHHGERLAIGTPEEVQADPAVVESYLGKAVAP